VSELSAGMAALEHPDAMLPYSKLLSTALTVASGNSNSSDGTLLLIQTSAAPGGDVMATGAGAGKLGVPSMNSYLVSMAWPKSLAVAVFLVIILVTVVGNTLVILAVLTTRRLRTVTNCFVMNLAITDWLVGTCVMPPSVVLYITGENGSGGPVHAHRWPKIYGSVGALHFRGRWNRGKCLLFEALRWKFG